MHDDWTDVTMRITGPSWRTRGNFPSLRSDRRNHRCVGACRAENPRGLAPIGEQQLCCDRGRGATAGDPGLYPRGDRPNGSCTHRRRISKSPGIHNCRGGPLRASGNYRIGAQTLPKGRDDHLRHRRERSCRVKSRSHSGQNGHAGEA